MVTIRIPLALGLVADILSEETDRMPSAPPPLARTEHDLARCGCVDCVLRRRLDRATLTRGAA